MESQQSAPLHWKLTVPLNAAFPTVHPLKVRVIEEKLQELKPENEVHEAA
jgi:hypothetical protein